MKESEEEMDEDNRIHGSVEVSELESNQEELTNQPASSVPERNEKSNGRHKHMPLSLDKVLLKFKKLGYEQGEKDRGYIEFREKERFSIGEFDEFEALVHYQLGNSITLLHPYCVWEEFRLSAQDKRNVVVAAIGPRMRSHYNVLVREVNDSLDGVLDSAPIIASSRVLFNNLEDFSMLLPEEYPGLKNDVTFATQKIKSKRAKKSAPKKKKLSRPSMATRSVSMKKKRKKKELDSDSNSYEDTKKRKLISEDEDDDPETRSAEVEVEDKNDSNLEEPSEMNVDIPPVGSIHPELQLSQPQLRTEEPLVHSIYPANPTPNSGSLMSYHQHQSPIQPFMYPQVIPVQLPYAPYVPPEVRKQELDRLERLEDGLHADNMLSLEMNRHSKAVHKLKYG